MALARRDQTIGDMGAAAYELATKRVQNLREQFGWLAKGWIGVSFVHMAGVMLLFRDRAASGFGGFISTIAILAMVLGIDMGLMLLASYIEVQRAALQEWRAIHHDRTDLQPTVGFWQWLAFLIVLLVEFTFNTAALWSHRPAPEVLPEWASATISILFGGFVSLIIYVSSTIQPKLDRTLAGMAIAEQQRQQAATEAAEAAVKQRKKDDEDEAYRRRLREQKLQNKASESHNETKTMPKLAAVVGLDELLAGAGLTRANALALLAERGIETAEGAYDMLAKFDKIPAGVDRETFGRMFAELAESAPRNGNGKARIGTKDIPAMVAALRAAGVTQLASTAELGRICDWSSSSTPPAGCKTLVDAGILQPLANGGFMVVLPVEEVQDAA